MGQSSKVMGLMIAFLVFFGDCMIASIENRWVVHFLVIYFVCAVAEKKGPGLMPNHALWCLFFLVVEDGMIYGRVGISLLYLVPMLLIGSQIRKILLSDSLFSYYFLMSLFFIGHWVILRFFILQKPIATHSTIVFVLANLACITLYIKCRTLMGVRGNRFGG